MCGYYLWTFVLCIVVLLYNKHVFLLFQILSSQQRKSIIDAYKRKTKENPTIRIRKLNGVLSKELQIGIGYVSKTVKEYRESVKSSNRTAVSKTVSNKAVKFNTMKRKVSQL